MTDEEVFEKHGYVRVNDFIDTQTISVISQYFENKIRRGLWKEIESSACRVTDKTSRYSYYADPLIEVILLSSKDAVENIIGKELIPTYSYSRIYQPGEKLSPHQDRPECEVSVTVNVANKGKISPIYMQYKDNDPEKHILSPGDAVVYKGCEAMHWRQPLNNDQLNVQFMLHYVYKNGTNAGLAKDGREMYGMPSSRLQAMGDN